MNSGFAAERQITQAAHGHLLTNVAVWSADGNWIVYDRRSDPAGSVFDGRRIERVNLHTGMVQTLYESSDGACCGVVTCSPMDDRVVFIHGPEKPTAQWSYNAWHRRGVVVHTSFPGNKTNLDARNLTAPFTAGALRGGTHVHTFSGDGKWVAFTYEDHVLASLGDSGTDSRNQRNVGVSVPASAVLVPRSHPRNHDGSHFSVLVTRTKDQPRPGSDEISAAVEDGWVGTSGYLRPDGSRQNRAIAFQGQVVTAQGRNIHEVFIVDLPDDLTQPAEAPLQGTEVTRPCPPKGVVQRRLTYTSNRLHPGLQGPRHWLRSSPDGSRIAFLMKDDSGVVQLGTISPNGGEPSQLTHNEHDVASAFSWRFDGRFIAHLMDGSVCITDTTSGNTKRLTRKNTVEKSARPEACVFSPRGEWIAYVCPVRIDGHWWNQIFVCSFPAESI